MTSTATDTTTATDLVAPALTAPGEGAQAGAVRDAVEARAAARSRADSLRSADPEAYGVPTGREEEWRFTPLAPLRELLEGTASDARLRWTTDLPAGVTTRVAGDGDPVVAGAPLPVDRVSALATARSGGAIVVEIPPESAPDRPVRIRLEGIGDLVWGYLVVQVGRFATATVVLEHVGTGRYAEQVVVLAGDGATVKVVHVHDWADDAVHAAHVALQVGRDATVESTHVTLGGRLVRVTETAEFTGPGGDVTLNGLYFAVDGQHHEHRLFVDHAHPQCRSNVLYKGALLGAGSRTVWIGDVLIRAAAEGTDTFELNRNLVLTAGARADSVPNLEIETGEIEGAGHASATGRFDDEQLFYLQARGIPPLQARRLVTRGFFAEVLARLDIPELEERLMAVVDARLAADAAAGAAPEAVPGTGA
ncbi:MAG: SufD family Fe-S cluster assembly protein [Kineosporiaceae bacterium]